MADANQFEVAFYKSAFLDLFPDDCREDCIVAKAASSKVTKSFIESGMTFTAYAEHYAHRFGRCVLGPDIEGMCGKKSLCNNELIGGEENPIEAAEILVDI